MIFDYILSAMRDNKHVNYDSRSESVQYGQIKRLNDISILRMIIYILCIIQFYFLQGGTLDTALMWAFIGLILIPLTFVATFLKYRVPKTFIAFFSLYGIFYLILAIIFPGFRGSFIIPAIPFLFSILNSDKMTRPIKRPNR